MRINMFIVFMALSVIACFGGGCANSSDEICDKACTAWEVDNCWGYDLCWDDCKADGDWSNAYAQCVEDNAGDCINLEVICG